MEKLLIHLYVPALAREYDLFVPQDVTIRKVTNVIESGIQELSSGRYTPSGKALLTVQGGKQPLDPEQTMMMYGLHDGEDLVLI